MRLRKVHLVFTAHTSVPVQAIDLENVKFRKLEKAVAVSGGLRGFPRKTPGKSQENSWKSFPEASNATNSRISGTGKGKPAGNLGLTLPGPGPHLPCGVFFEIDSSSLLEFF